MMSFGRAVDHTSIAQLVGCMVRTPLARTVDRNEFLNSVSLYLPHYDSKALKKVIDYLRSDEPGGGIASDIRSGADVVTLGRRDDIADILAALSALPTYRVERVSNARWLTFQPAQVGQYSGGAHSAGQLRQLFVLANA